MPRLRKFRPLSCFYCGKRSKKLNDGTVRSFECEYCDATNYLDENGDITDPPVATDREPPAPQYTTQQLSSHTIPSTDSIFCETCLKNQRLYTASLAQYLPDDPDDPSYEALERDYYRFRRGLEKRYPQVCGACADKVERRIQNAVYTAKTDHLRKMMARTRGKAILVGRRRTKTDWVEVTGRWLWWAGLGLQLLWHMKMAVGILKQSAKDRGEGTGGMRDPDGAEWSEALVKWLGHWAEALPPAPLLMKGSIGAAVLSSWWNPRFVQVSRGFSRHLLGFRQWYSFQGLIVFFRMVFRRLGDVPSIGSDSLYAQTMPHLVMAGLMVMIYVFAQRSIKVDTTPLFGYSTSLSSVPSSPTRPMTATEKAESRKEDQQTLSSVLDEVLNSPTKPRQPNPISPNLRHLPSPQQASFPIRSPTPTFTQSAFSRPETPRAEGGDPDVMDWTPTQSQHRAFNNAPSSGTPARPFSQTPVQPEGGAFWYKVPSAPQNPAQKLRSPPQVPIMRASKPIAQDQGLSFGGAGLPLSDQNDGMKPKQSVEFQRPKFFAPDKDDETAGLADILNKSFSLGADEDGADIGHEQHKAALSRSAGSPGRTPHTAHPTTALHAALLALWLVTHGLPPPYDSHVQLFVAILAGGLALSGMGASTNLMTHDKAATAALYLLPVLELSELAGLCWVGWTTWASDEEIFMHGIGVLGLGIGRQLVLAMVQ